MGFDPVHFIAIDPTSIDLDRCRSRSVSAPPGMREGGYLLVGEVYSVPWRYLERLYRHQLSTTGPSGYQMDERSFRYVCQVVQHLHHNQCCA